MLFRSLWSVPLVFFLFLLAGSYSMEYFGDGLISTEYIQQIILAALVLVFANFVVFLGINFNFRGLQRYFYSREARQDAEYIQPWQKFTFYLVVYFGLLLAYLFILRLIMTATVSALPQPLM